MREEYLASRLAREALEDVKCPKQIRYEEIRPYFTQRDAYRTPEDLNEVVLGVAVFTEYLKTRQAYRFHPVLASELNAATELNFRMQDLQKATPSVTRYWDVGYRYVKAYKREFGFVPVQMDTHVQKTNKSTHHSPRRHLRAAHWHTYLYGPGKKLRKVLWVAATWVGIGEEDVDVIHVQE